MSILAFLVERSMYNFRVENDRVVDICPKLVKQNHGHENRLLCGAIAFDPIRIGGTVNVHGLKTLPSLPRTIERVMMLHRLLCMRQPISKDSMESLVNRKPLPELEKEK